MKIKKFFPLILIELYLIISYLMYRYGCYVWSFRKDNYTLVFMLAVVVFMGIGYTVAVCRNSRKKEIECNKFMTISCEKILLICCIVSCMIYVPMCISYTNSWYPPVIKALSDPKGVYYALAEIGKNRTGVRIWGFMDVFPYAMLPLLLYGWEKISLKVRCFAGILVVGYLMIYISSGRNIMVAVQMLSVVAACLGIICRKKTEQNKRHAVIRKCSLGIVYCIIVVSYFNLTISARSGYTAEVAENFEAIKEENNLLENMVADTTMPNPDVSTGGNDSFTVLDENQSNVNSEIQQPVESPAFVDEFAYIAKDWDSEEMGQHLGIGVYEYNGLEITQEQLMKFNQVYKIFPNYTDIWSKAYVNVEDPIMEMLPSSLRNLYVIATGYITNGYNCLTVALHTDHEWTYGIGHSTFLSSYADAFLGTNITKKTYYSRLTGDEVYPLVSKSLWASTFVQMADDLTFFGVVLFMGVLGFIIAQIWISVIDGDNYWGVVLWGQVELGVLFLPANNVLGGSGGFFVTFWITFIAWLITQIPARHRSEKSRSGK